MHMDARDTHLQPRIYELNGNTPPLMQEGGSTQPVPLSCLLSLLHHVVEYLLLRSEFERWRVEEARYRGSDTGKAWGGGVTTDFPGRLHSSLCHIVISGAGRGEGGNGVKPRSGRMEGWKEGRGGTIVMEGTANCRACSPDCRDLQEGGGGENHCSHFEKGGGYKTALGVMVCHKTSTTAAQLT